MKRPFRGIAVEVRGDAVAVFPPASWGGSLRGDIIVSLL